MIRARDCLATLFVINCLINIQCSVNNNLSNELIDIDKSPSEELNPKYTEVYELRPPRPNDQDANLDESDEDCQQPYNNCQDDPHIIHGQMFVLTVTEVVVGTAIIMGLSALVTVLLKICSRPRLARTQNNQMAPDEFGRMGIRVSLTSLQQRVMSKLRDRPPRYETRHNYEYQRRSDISTRIPVLNPGASYAVPPPAYEATSDNNNSSMNDLPPAYTIALADTDTGEVVNHSFVSDESQITIEGANNTESGAARRNPLSDNNIIHM